MRLQTLLSHESSLEPLAALLAERGHEVTRAPTERLADHLATSSVVDLVALPSSGDAEAIAALCRVIRAIRASAPDAPLVVAGPTPERAALDHLLDAGANALLVTSLGAPLLEAQLLPIEKAARRQAAARSAPEVGSAESFRMLAELVADFCLRVRFDPAFAPGASLTAKDDPLAIFSTATLEWSTRGFSEIIGPTREDVAQRALPLRLLHPLDMQEISDWLTRIYRGEQASTKARILHRSGELRWFRVFGAPLRERPTGPIVGMIAAGRDISSSIRASEELRNQAAALSSIIHHAPLAIIAVDYAGVVTIWNPAAERLFGWTAEEAVGRPNPLIPAQEWSGFELLLENAFCGQLETTVEQEHRRKDGTLLSIAMSRAVLFDADGAPTGLMAMLADITERRQLEASLRMAERFASVGRLASAVGHEINNPLAYVLTNLNLVLEQLAERSDGTTGRGAHSQDEAIEMLREAREGAERVRHIVRDLRTFSQAEGEKRGPVDPRQVLDACVNMARAEVRHRARLVKRYTETPPVVANEAHLGQVMLNLLINAADAIAPGAPEENEIQIATCVGEDGRVVIEVRDTGAGIPREVVERIFEPFFTTKGRGRGTGLGLSVCYGIVSALGGEITVESEVGRGSCFRVHLPAGLLEAPPPAAIAPQAERGSAPSALAREAPRHTSSKREVTMSTPLSESKDGKPARGRLLVIDDEPPVARAIARFLREHEVTVVESGGAALEAIRKGASFDVILCDLMMPDLTGMEVHAALQAERPELAARMIFMTGGVFTDQAAEFLDRVVNPRLDKPFDHAAVKRAVAEMVSSPPQP